LSTAMICSSVYCLAFMSPPGFFIIPEDSKSWCSCFRGEGQSKLIAIPFNIKLCSEIGIHLPYVVTNLKKGSPKGLGFRTDTGYKIWATLMRY
jgi:hypothetical protein